MKEYSPTMLQEEFKNHSIYSFKIRENLISFKIVSVLGRVLENNCFTEDKIPYIKVDINGKIKKFITNKK